VNVFVDGKLHSVNAISGDMFKHIQSEHLHRLATHKGLPLSEGARTFNANRINYDVSKDEAFLDALKKARTNAEELDLILQRCAVTDIAGTLVTAEKRSLPRKSVVEFGWVVGIPNKVKTDSYFHVKYESERGEGSAAVDASGSISGKQTPFHRPASSGAYALVLNIEAARVGFNDISQTYAVSDDERAERLRVLLESVLHTFVEPAGAMRSTQNPHILDLVGVITVSRDVVPAPCISPLKSDFISDIKRVAESLNKLRPNAIEVQEFSSLGEFAEKMVALIQTATPFTLPVAQQT
ncbi:MAG: DevR family CRISPR-associated autoregulator, partial [Candidatus Roseilinea sp.]|uniref:DevR family CRISPR-associated autoregulator n=1 Tax=Candidatus Roseilinea sp. TaxID=2838777 RepID=UPI00404AD5A7